MEFIIFRTSRDGKPCEEAVLKNYMRVDERSIDDPSKFITEEKTSWYLHGTNHRAENGHIKRDFQAQEWFVEIYTLTDLINLNNKYGALIIENSINNSSIKSIEIYDSYRE
jgi:hypothetical protein